MGQKTTMPTSLAAAARPLEYDVPERYAPEYDALERYALDTAFGGGGFVSALS